MDNVVTHEDWKVCFSQLAPVLLLFARQWLRSSADAEDVVQEAFVRFWRCNHNIENRALLYATVRSIALDFLRRDHRRARRESDVVSEIDHSALPKFTAQDGAQMALVACVAE